MAVLAFYCAKDLPKREPSADQNRNAGHRPEKYSAFSDECESHADPDSDPDRFGNELSPGLVNSNEKGNQLEDDRDQPADRFEQKSVESGCPRVRNAGKNEPDLKHAERMKGGI